MAEALGEIVSGEFDLLRRRKSPPFRTANRHERPERSRTDPG